MYTYDRRATYTYDRRVAKQKPERKPIEVQKGYHVSPSAFTKKMLEKGVEPKSKGNLGGEFARDKTYFFRSLSDAVESALDRLRDADKPLTFESSDVLDLQHAVVEFDLKGLPTYADPEMPDEAGFTVKKIPKESVKLVGFDEWKPIVTAYGKRHKMPVKFPGAEKESDKPSKEPPRSEPKEKPKAEKPKGEASSDWKSFLEEVGDQKVPNPNPESRARFPRVMIKSLAPDKQRAYYDKWKV